MRELLQLALEAADGDRESRMVLGDAIVERQWAPLEVRRLAGWGRKPISPKTWFGMCVTGKRTRLPHHRVMRATAAYLLFRDWPHVWRWEWTPIPF